MTVRQAWTSRDDETSRVSSRAMGDGHRLPLTDNMLVIDPTCDVRDDPMTQSGSVSHADLTWDNFARDQFNGAGFPPWVRIRELSRRQVPEVIWEVHISHPDEIIGWNVFGGFRETSIYPNDVEAVS